nr:reverse transcriptase domain-containing protein [Tanacetum cinerariifolium]
MQTRASNSELVEPLSEPERTLNRKLRRRNRGVPYDQRNNPPQNPRIVYPLILDINYFHHFLVTLENLYLMDDEPIWAADRVVAPNPGSTITIPETANEFSIKDAENEVVHLMMFPLSLIGEAKTWLDELNERTFETSNTDTDKIMPRMDAMTIKMDAQYKELQSHAKKTMPNLDDDYMPMSREEEAKFMQTFYEGSKILYSIEETLLEEEIFSEFNEFMAMTVDENSKSESDTKESPFKKITINTDYKIKTSLKEPHTNLELTPFPDNLEYVFLEEPSFLFLIISSKLSAQNKSKLVFVLKNIKKHLHGKTYIPGIYPLFCKHKIQLLDDKKLVVQKQRRLNPNMQEVVKKAIVKLLDTGIIYPIIDSPWVSPIHCVPKKGGITVVTIKNDELVPTRIVTGWRVCIDYRKLIEATAKDHFPLPFMDQKLERLARNKYFYFLDGFSGYFQIPIDPMDQEKITFTCPFGTYAYRRMPFGLCNAPATFQDACWQSFTT